MQPYPMLLNVSLSSVNESGMESCPANTTCI